MPKRKKPDTEKSSKQQKFEPENQDNTIITKQTEKSENIPWNDSELLELISKIEKNIPIDDCLSYSTRLEKIDWSTITIKSRSLEECKQVWMDLSKHIRKFRLLQEIVIDMKNWVKNPKPIKDNNKHPKKPKQPLNSYIFFTEEKRSEVMNEYPKLPPTDVAKKLGQMYKNLNPQEKEKYENLAKLAREEYTKQLERFYSEHPELATKKTSKPLAKNAPVIEAKHTPDRPKTPFQLFLQVEEDKEEYDTSRYVFIQKCRERWKALSDKDKLFWINWAEEQYDKYLNDLKEYLKNNPTYKPQNVTVLTKKEKRIKARCLGKPDKPPHSTYHLFTKMMIETEEIRKIDNRQVVYYISEKWKACSDEEKNEYKIRLEQMWEEYNRKLDKYLMTVPSEERHRVVEEDTKKKRKRSTSETVVKESKVKKPEPPPLTDYKYFLSVYNGKENPSVIWKNMTEDEKKVFEDKLKALRRNYIICYEQYLRSLSKEELHKIGDSYNARFDTSSESDSESSED